VTNDLRGLNPYLFAAERPAAVTGLARIAAVPLLLSGSLALMAMGTFAHVLVSSTRRRRRDLAILQTLGFVPGQVRRALGWQAAILAVIALLIGLPAGIAAGRWGWTIFADQLGVLPEPVVPTVGILLAIPTTLALAYLTATLPGRAVTRHPPATNLRSE
jgi:putative ABC transport system permease protein